MAGMFQRTSSRIFVAFSLCLLSIIPFAAAHAQSVTEKIEWTWANRPEHPDSALPNVLLLGDSITRAYYEETSRLLAGHANCYLFATSASSGDPRLPKQIADFWTIAPSFALIHFNNGMHGWGYTEPQYAEGLPSLVSTLRRLAPQAVLIWANTTPVRKPTVSGASNARIDARNQLALTLIHQQHIPIDDQNALMLQHQDLHQDDVHFSPAGSAIQAQQVTESILKLLPPH